MSHKLLRFMVLLQVILTISFFAASAVAKEPECSDLHNQSVEFTRLGEHLVRQLWARIKQQDMATIEEIIADGFQSVHNDGAHDRQEEIKLIGDLDMGEYRLDNFQVTREGSVLVVTYRAAVEETINGQRLSARPAARMSLFLKTNSGWKLIAHSNFKGLRYKKARDVAAFVNDAAALIAQQGESSFDELRTKGGRWFQGDLYLFVWDLKGMRYVYPPDPSGEGHNMAHLQDIDNKPIGELLIKVASSVEGKGWVHYRWPKPGRSSPVGKAPT